MKTMTPLRAAAGGLFAVTIAYLSACSTESRPSEATRRTADHLTGASNRSGFVWSWDATDNYTANTAYQSEPNIAITHVSTGLYVVAFPNTPIWPDNSPGGNVGGNVHVTTYGGGNQRCKVEDWWRNGTTFEASVACYAPDGTATDSQFTATFHQSADPSGAVSGGYVWAFAPVSPSYDASSVRSWNSTALPITISRDSPGSYTVTFAGQGSINGGTAEATAYGMDSNYCEVGGWWPSGADALVNVLCFSAGGTPADSMFTLAFSQDSPNGAATYTYAWSGLWQTGTYTAPSTYQSGSILLTCGTQPTPGPVTITYQGTGSYDVYLPGMPVSGNAGDSLDTSNVIVTAYGQSGENCGVSYWGGDTSGATVRVACFDPWGNPADSMFTITYSSPLYIVC